MSRFIVITGPTASGKTLVSVEVAKAIGGEIICADSMQVYRGCDIGTAKATKEEQQGVRHHMIDVIGADEEYSVAEFQKSAFSLIEEINGRERVPIVSGGTGLYINSLVYDLDFGGGRKNEGLRQKYAQLTDDKNTEYLYNILKEKDPKYASVISGSDTRRIIRRLEILETQEQPAYNFRRYNDRDEYILLGLTMPRDMLYKRIEARVDDMMEAGLPVEVKTLYEKYGDVNALKAIGYKELVSYINGECGFEDAVRLVKRNTRRFAKRQMTWFKRDERITWFDISTYSCIEDTINDIIIYIKGKGF
jgi:tRNA dimethylallyltransferase